MIRNILISLFFILVYKVYPATFQTRNSEKRVALIVGNSSYKDYPLNNPTNDAKKMKETLESVGFEVIIVLNSTQKNLKAAISTFGNKLSSQRNTIGLFYYAGHGIQANGKNYLVPVDANITSEADYEINCVNIEVLNDYIERASNQMNIIILDACRNNPFAKKNRSFGTAGGLVSFNAPTGTMIAFATAPGKVAADGSEVNGLYTQELIKAIKIPNIKIEDVFKRVRIQVKKLSQDEQIPWENSSITGDFYFTSDNSPAVNNNFEKDEIVDIPVIKKEVNTDFKNQGLIYIKGTSFKMGATNRPYNEFPVHVVNLNDFWISKYEVTVKEWKMYCQATQKEMPTPIGMDFENTNITSYWNKIENNPITNISWTEAIEYANWYSLQMGLNEVYVNNDGVVSWNRNANGFRLPTEAEWELAAKGGGKGSNYLFAGSNIENEISWFSENSDDKTHPVGLKKANEANLYDMSGNVWEWCYDWYDEYYYKNSEKDNPSGVSIGTMKSIRGGSWLSTENRISIRKGRTPKTKSTEIGFRLVRNN